MITNKYLPTIKRIKTEGKKNKKKSENEKTIKQKQAEECRLSFFN